MESLLKVYIYKEGEKPIFHDPELLGIYSSEGWFMKHMQESTRFLVDDPSKAHLFYMPFGSHHLQQKLYLPNSHSHDNLVEFLQNYVFQIAAKYPFWNRTDGSDHFSVSCHDWVLTCSLVTIICLYHYCQSSYYYYYLLFTVDTRDMESDGDVRKSSLQCGHDRRLHRGEGCFSPGNKRPKCRKSDEEFWRKTGEEAYVSSFLRRPDARLSPPQSRPSLGK